MRMGRRRGGARPHSRRVEDLAMRLAAVACAFALVVCVAVFAAILSQRSPVPGSASSEQAAPAKQPVQVVTTVEEQNAPGVATTGLNLAPSSEETTNTPTVAAPTPVSSQVPPTAPRAVAPCPGNPDALGISRVVEIDTTGGPGFGFEHFKSHDFLREGEVVLTFDDGPWPKNTQAVLSALAAQCTKAIFFPIGLHATYEPAILKQVAA